MRVHRDGSVSRERHRGEQNDEELVRNQVEQRTRRRKRMSVTYGPVFDLLREVHDICAPLGKRVTAEPTPTLFWSDADSVTEAVHRLVVMVAGLVVLADAQRSAAHLPLKERERAVQMLQKLAERPQAPAVAAIDLTTGSWVQALDGLVGPYSGKLSDLLARPLAPGTRRGLPSVNEQLIEALRTVDVAAQTMEQHLKRAAAARKTATARAAATAANTSAARSELLAMGIEV